jgi:hypothetical protein
LFHSANINNTNPASPGNEIGRNDSPNFTVTSTQPPGDVSFCRIGISGRSRSPETGLQDEASLASVGSVGRGKDRAFGGGGLV